MPSPMEWNMNAMSEAVLSSCERSKWRRLYEPEMISSRGHLLIIEHHLVSDWRVEELGLLKFVIGV